MALSGQFFSGYRHQAIDNDVWSTMKDVRKYLTRLWSASCCNHQFDRWRRNERSKSKVVLFEFCVVCVRILKNLSPSRSLHNMELSMSVYLVTCALALIAVTCPEISNMRPGGSWGNSVRTSWQSGRLGIGAGIGGARSRDRGGGAADAWC